MQREQKAGYETTENKFELLDSQSNKEATFKSFAESVSESLSQNPKTLNCFFFYDELGSQLFEQITQLEEYYPSTKETEILAKNAEEIVGLCPRGTVLVELGSGSSTKTQILLEAFLKQSPLTYIPIDISETILTSSSRFLLEKYENLVIKGVPAEYNRGLAQIKEYFSTSPLLIAWLGTSIGNVKVEESIEFLKSIRQNMKATDRLLIGADLWKSSDVMVPAYDDSKGINAQFNKNILTRINKELGGNFDLDKFDHQIVYNREHERIEMHLASTEDQTCTIKSLNMMVSFKKGETIHTENSHKFTFEKLSQIGTEAGLTLEHHWQDSKEMMSLNLFVPF
eukprot:TRINITY_DN2018_c0_g1_i3.p1 TRINITY_DN2018_c0_g1~~TRINITY_DN2018_c0_g1_i3.p1  ORF type:complete len:340 (+),score=42.26 TRINITY_DN2018_c0_g1_i3:65-1084(+)